MVFEVRQRQAKRAVVGAVVALAGAVVPATMASAHGYHRQRAPRLISPPEVTGTPAVGEPLATSYGEWSNTPSGFGIDWQRCHAVSLACTPIDDAHSDTYVPGVDDIGFLIRSVVTATNESGIASAAAGPTTAVRSAVPAEPGPPSTEGVLSVVVNGVSRSWKVSLPDPSPAAKVPFVVVLGSSEPSADDTVQLTALVASLNKAGAAVAVAAPATKWVGNESDTAFLDVVVGHAVSSGVADATRVTMAGYRDGALAAGRYACVRAGTLAAVSLIGIGHDSDATFTATNCAATGAGAGSVPIHVMSAVDDPADIAVQYWLARNQCTGEIQQFMKATPFAVVRYESFGCSAALRFDTVAAPLDQWVEEDGYSTREQVWAFLSKFSRAA